MGLLRHDEAPGAGAVLGLAPDAYVFLGYPDSHVMSLWNEHWGEGQPPFQSRATRAAAVPYGNARRPGAPYRGDEIVRDLVALLREFRPTRVFVSHPVDRNLDHAALYLFTRVALWTAGNDIAPSLHPYLVHFPRWPVPRGWHPGATLAPPDFFDDPIVWESFPLRPHEVEAKAEALRAHASQMKYAAHYLTAFVRRTELFGDYPVIALAMTNPPVQGVSVPIRDPDPAGTTEELTEEERARFVGIVWRRVSLQGREFVVTIGLSRPLGGAVSASVHACGYRADRSFAEMPKLRVEVSALDHTVRDPERVLPDHTATVTRHPKAIAVRMPLAALGNPQRVFFSARTYLGELPLDWAAWRIVEVPVLPAGG
jgi:LmbE family N-acetylglucosaminyl deacetylase